MSLFHHMRAWKCFQYDGDWDGFVDLFLSDRVETSSWFDHIREWALQRSRPNVLFLMYEDMKKDLPAAIRQIAQFMGVHGLGDDAVKRIAELSSFESMKADPSANLTWLEEHRKDNAQPFIRRGTVGRSIVSNKPTNRNLS